MSIAVQNVKQGVIGMSEIERLREINELHGEHISNLKGLIEAKNERISILEDLRLDTRALNEDLDKAEAAIESLLRKNASLQARIDSLMLEYCHEEMSKRQIDALEKHQKEVLEFEILRDIRGEHD